MNLKKLQQLTQILNDLGMQDVNAAKAVETLGGEQRAQTAFPQTMQNQQDVATGHLLKGMEYPNDMMTAVLSQRGMLPPAYGMDDAQIMQQLLLKRNPKLLSSLQAAGVATPQSKPQ